LKLIKFVKGNTKQIYKHSLEFLVKSLQRQGMSYSPYLGRTEQEQIHFICK